MTGNEGQVCNIILAPLPRAPSLAHACNASPHCRAWQEVRLIQYDPVWWSLKPSLSPLPTASTVRGPGEELLVLQVTSLPQGDAGFQMWSCPLGQGGPVVS